MSYYKYSYTHNHISFKSYIYKIGSYHYNWHPEIEVLVLLTGRVEVLHGGIRTILEPGDVIVYSAQIGHATLALEDNSLAMVCHIDLDYFTGFDKNFKKYKFEFSSTKETRQNLFYKSIRRYMAKLMQVQAKNNRDGYNLYVECLITELATCLYGMIECVKVIPKGVEPAKESEATFNRILQYIDEHYHERVTLEQLAMIGGYNTDYTSQFFKRQMGISFMEYLMRIRLRDAIVLLANTDSRIVEIANECGFTDVKAFNLAFKKFFSMTPSQYRHMVEPFHEMVKLENWKQYISVKNHSVAAILYQWAEEKGEHHKNQSVDLQTLQTLLADVQEMQNRIQELIKNHE